MDNWEIMTELVKRQEKLTEGIVKTLRNVTLYKVSPYERVTPREGFSLGACIGIRDEYHDRGTDRIYITVDVLTERKQASFWKLSEGKFEFISYVEGKHLNDSDFRTAVSLKVLRLMEGIDRM